MSVTISHLSQLKPNDHSHKIFHINNLNNIPSSMCYIVPLPCGTTLGCVFVPRPPGPGDIIVSPRHVMIVGTAGRRRVPVLMDANAE